MGIDRDFDSLSDKTRGNNMNTLYSVMVECVVKADSLEEAESYIQNKLERKQSLTTAGNLTAVEVVSHDDNNDNGERVWIRPDEVLTGNIINYSNEIPDEIA